MDEFHWYADRDRGVAWQMPLLTLPHTRFLLMSATLGDTTFFEEALTALNGRPTRHRASRATGPVPLEFAYAEIPLAHTLEKLADEGKTPVYVVHFTQADAAGERAGLHEPEDLHARGEGGASRRRSPTSSSPAPTGRRSASG